MDIRCDNGILFGVMDLDKEHPTIEVKCRSGRCGHKQGAVVLHVFSLSTGELVETLQFKNPIRKEP